MTSYISILRESCLSVGQKPEDSIPSGSKTRSFRKSSQRFPVTTSTTAAPMSMPTLEYWTLVPGSKRIGCDAAVAATDLNGMRRDHPPISTPLGSSNGNPPVWFITILTVSSLFAFTRVLTPSSFEVSTQSSLNSGRYLETGSSSEILPSSTRMAIVTPQKPFVCEHCMYGSSIVIGRFASMSE